VTSAKAPMSMAATALHGARAGVNAQLVIESTRTVWVMIEACWQYRRTRVAPVAYKVALVTNSTHATRCPDRFTRHPVRVLGRQEHGQRRDIFWLAKAA